MQKELTGRTVLIITVSAFAVIFAVNMTLLWAAIGTFPGLEVKNSYVASQSFDADRRAQAALGWTSEVSYADGRILLDLRDATGAPVRGAKIDGVVGRIAYAGEDRALTFLPAADGLAASAILDVGLWQVRLQGVSADGTAFRRRLDLRVAP